MNTVPWMANTAAALPHPAHKASNTHQREDYVTWWQYGASIGSRILYWRDKEDLTGADVSLDQTRERIVETVFLAAQGPSIVFWLYGDGQRQQARHDARIIE